VPENCKLGVIRKTQPSSFAPPSSPCPVSPLFLRRTADPRWGRGQETPGEDPYVNAEYAATFVSGMQGGGSAADPLTDPRHLKISSACKHFDAYSLEVWNSSLSRYNFNAVVSEQDLADTYYVPFQSCVQRGKSSGLMCSCTSLRDLDTAGRRPSHSPCCCMVCSAFCPRQTTPSTAFPAVRTAT
jgi:hypothetical protein